MRDYILQTDKYMIKLKYGNTNTYFIGGLLIDTDYAGTLPSFYKALKAAGISIPVMIGGATTSELHTALKIATEYDGAVVWLKDAAQNVVVAQQLLDPLTRDTYTSQLKERQAALRKSYTKAQPQLLSLEEARQRKGGRSQA